MNCSPPGSSVHGISQARYWKGLPFPSSGDLLNPWIEPTSSVYTSLAGEFFTPEPPGKQQVLRLCRSYFFRKITTSYLLLLPLLKSFCFFLSLSYCSCTQQKARSSLSLTLFFLSCRGCEGQAAQS